MGIMSTDSQRSERLMLTDQVCEEIAGKPLCVHASMRSFTPRLAPDVLLDALLGLGCTIMMPTFTYALEQPPPAVGRPERNGMDDSFGGRGHGRCYDSAENELSQADMGALPAALLRRSRERGEHPLNSFASVGPLSAELIARQTLQDVYGPFEALIEHDGLVLLAGVGCTSLTLIHYAEQLAGRTLFQRWARVADGCVVACATGSCSTAFDRFDEVLSERAFEVRGSRWRIMEAGTAASQAAAAIRADQRMTHCGRSTCLRCRDGLAGGPLL